MKRKPIKVNLNIMSSKNIIDPYFDKKEIEIKRKLCKIKESKNN